MPYHLHHAAGFAAILIGVYLATRAGRRGSTAPPTVLSETAD